MLLAISAIIMLGIFLIFCSRTLGPIFDIFGEAIGTVGEKIREGIRFLGMAFITGAIGWLVVVAIIVLL